MLDFQMDSPIYLFFTNDGRTIFLEAKIKPNVLSKDQINFIKVMRSRGFYADAVFSINDLETMISNDFNGFLYEF